MMLSYVAAAEMARLRDLPADRFTSTRLFADVLRINCLYMIMRAGSGHVGTSFSSLDLMTWLWTQELRLPNEKTCDYSDTFFSSKGHDAPAMYSVLIGTGRLPEDRLHVLRRLGGLPGHPDVQTPYVPTNTGSLGMGISKARGMALANRLRGRTGRFFVMTGDGELQEGQIWESLLPTANGGFGEITVVVDHNTFQSDTRVRDVSDLGDLEARFRSHGWEVARCNGHAIEEMASVFEAFRGITDTPKVLIADTVKGKGVSFMEHTALKDEHSLYAFHSGAPSQQHYDLALRELVDRVDAGLSQLCAGSLALMTADPKTQPKPLKPQRLVNAYGEELLRLAELHSEIVSLDADLMLDCGLIPFRKAFPDRYVQCGIAEQDMVSVAGGLALSGLRPVVHSFACFLTTRPCEQIYNNATEKTPIIYVGSLAGVLPGGPGHSHQSVRDVALMGSLPGMTVIQPSCEAEARLALRWAVETNPDSTYIRLVSLPLDLPFDMPPDHVLNRGIGARLTEGTDAILFAYGPVMLSEAVTAARQLSGAGIGVRVINMPWLNVVNRDWLTHELTGIRAVFMIDDHYGPLSPSTYLGSEISSLGAPSVIVHTRRLNEIPACGWNQEVLEHHGLDAASIYKWISSTHSIA